MLIALLIVIAIFFFWQWKCKSKPVLDIDPVEQREARVDTILEKDTRAEDSIAALQIKAESESELWKDYAQELEGKYTRLEKQVGSKIKDAPCPDEYVNDLTKDFSQLQIAIRDKDKACQKSLLAKDKEISLAKSANDIKSATIDQLKKEMAGCMKDTKKAVDLAENRARNELYAGIALNVYPVAGYGVTVGIKMKNGWMFDAQAMQMQGKTYGQISAKHTINLRK